MIDEREIQFRRVESPNDDDSEVDWTVLPRVTIDAVEVELSGLEVGVAYEVRSRTVTAEGRVGPWVRFDYVHQFTARAAPDVEGLALTDGDCLTWKLPAGSDDVVGVEIRSASGDMRHWEAAEPVHDGLWPAAPFPLCGVPGGQRTFMVVAVTEDGGRSETPAVIVEQRGQLDDKLELVAHTRDFGAAGFPGQLAGGTVVGPSIVASPALLTPLWRTGVGLQVDLWDDRPGAPLWDSAPYADLWPRRAGGEAPLWDPTPDAGLWDLPYAPTTYKATVDVPLNAVQGGEARLTIDAAATPAGWRVEYRRNGRPLWGDPSVPGLPLWDPDPNADLWPQDDARWLPWPGRIDRAGPGQYEIRVVLVSGAAPAQLTRLVVKASVEPRVERFTALAVSAAGTRVPLSSPFAQVLRLEDLVVRTTGTATSVLVSDLDPDKGPLLYCIDKDDAFCTGVVDGAVVGR